MSDPALPLLDGHGHLPEGIHDTSLAEIQQRFVTNPVRAELWRRLQDFLQWVISTEQFSHAYIDGGFTTDKESPTDIDVILQTRAGYGPEAFRAMMPFFEMGVNAIHQKYSIHLHFWSEGFPEGMADFRLFFQYLPPQVGGLPSFKERAKKGIVRISL